MKNTNNWEWECVHTDDDSITTLTYPAGKTMDEVHARLEVDYSDHTWDWTVSEEKREVSVFRNHWRVKEEEGRKAGKTQSQIWTEEAIGKCLRMEKMMREMGHTDEEAKEYTESLKRCWIKNRTLGGVVAFGGRPPMTEEDARAEVEKEFADYIAEYGDGGA